MGKSKKSDVSMADESVNQGDESQLDSSHVSWEDKTKYLSVISHPLASKKLTRKLYKTIKKAKEINSLRRGIKEVQKALRKGETGLVVLAGDVSPLDIISHIPVVCEEANVPYCYTPSKKDLGSAYGSTRQACMVLVKDHKDLKDDIKECKTKIDELN